MSIQSYNPRHSMPVRHDVWAHQNNIAHGSRPRPEYNPALHPKNVQNRIELQNKSNHNPNRVEYNYEKPLKRDTSAQIDFRGFSMQKIAKSLKKEFLSLKPVPMEFSKDEIRFAFNLLRKNEPVEALDMAKVLSNFYKKVRGDEKFFPEIQALVKSPDYKKGTIYGIPEKPFWGRLNDILVQKPVNAIKNGFKKQKENDLVKDFSNLQETLVSIRYWRKDKEGSIIKNILQDMINNEEISVGQDVVKLLEKGKVDRDILNKLNLPESKLKEINAKIDKLFEPIALEKLQSRETKQLNPRKPNYTPGELSTALRIVSGVLGGIFLSNDSYNTTIMYNNNKKLAKKEANSRFSQELARIGINAFLIYVTLGVFNKLTKNFMSAAIGISLATAVITETLGRKLIGKPILPQSKEKLDELKKEREENKYTFRGIVGSILAGDFSFLKKDDDDDDDDDDDKNKIVQNPVLNSQVQFTRQQMQNTAVNSNLFNKFTSNSPFSANTQTPAGSPVSFTGGITKYKKIAEAIPDAVERLFVKPNMYEKGELQLLLNKLHEIYPNRAERYKEIIEKGLEKLGSYKGVNYSGKKLDQLLNDPNITHIPVSVKESYAKRVIDAFIAPVYWVKGLANLVIVKGSRLIPGYGTKSKLQESIYKLEKHKLIDAFNEMTANVKDPKKQLEIAEKLLKDDKRLFTKLQGVQNTFEFIKKYYDKAKNEFNDTALRKDLRKEIFDGYAHKGTQYDANTYSKMNKNILGVNTALFVTSDAYNLALEYSNGDKEEASNKAKQRVGQEVAKRTLSAYWIHLTQELFKNMFNSSIKGACAVTALNVVTYESMARASVGCPVLRKDQAQLKHMEEKNKASKNPIIKALGKAMGKKSITSQAPDKANTKPVDTTSTSQKGYAFSHRIDSNSNFTSEYLKKIRQPN